MSRKGPVVCLALHAHLPYVKTDDSRETLEERWYYEAAADVYLPLLDVLNRLERDGVPFKLAMSVTPPLLAMLEDEELDAGVRRFLERRLELARLETVRLRADRAAAATAREYVRRYERLLKLFGELDGGRGWLARLRELAEQGYVELLASAATHAFLPLVRTAAARRAQIAAGAAEHARAFGRPPRGFWLPECGYAPDLDAPLLEETAEGAYTIVQFPHGPQRGAFRTPGGLTLLARHAPASGVVWDAASGYPGHADYRDYYEDIGFSLGHDRAAELDYIRPYLLPDGTRVSTGMKYARVTDRRGGPDGKQPYARGKALAAARRHAADWLRRLSQLDESPAPVVCAFDAELFGHWWFEGPDFLEALFRCAARRDGRRPVVLATPSEALSAARPEKLPPEAAGFSSWGRGGYADVWLQRKTDWMYPLLHAAEERMTAAADTAAAWARAAGGGAAGARIERVLAEAARELMLAQSSDWAFYLDAGTMPAYAVRRFQGHLDRMGRLLGSLEQGRVDGGGMGDLEPPPYGYRLLPALQAAWFRSGEAEAGAEAEVEALPPQPTLPEHRLRILMLAWEYPPHIVGGLGKAVGDLARELAAQGHAVHVVTRAPDDASSTAAAPVACSAVEDGVTVHRVPVPRSPEPVSFIDWVFQMNVAFAGCAARLLAHGARFDVLHAHDWLVALAAAELSAAAPLVATVHATEFGRRGGSLDGPVSPRLHAQEARLITAADEVIVCSESMRAELLRAHPNAPAQPRVIPCGHPAAAAPPPQLTPRRADAPVLAFLGRLVPEKGVQVLLAALPHLLAEFPALTLVIAGEGPLRPELEAQAAPFGERVRFAGFLAGDAKAALLAHADLVVMPSLYEPFGLVALEALAAGAPLLASDVGGLAGIVTPGVTGELAPPGDAGALAAHALALLRDPAHAAGLAAAAKRAVRERFAIGRTAAETVDAYEAAIARRASAQKPYV